MFSVPALAWLGGSRGEQGRGGPGLGFQLEIVQSQRSSS